MICIKNYAPMSQCWKIGAPTSQGSQIGALLRDQRTYISEVGAARVHLTGRHAYISQVDLPTSPVAHRHLTAITHTAAAASC